MTLVEYGRSPSVNKWKLELNNGGADIYKDAARLRHSNATNATNVLGSA